MKVTTEAPLKACVYNLQVYSSTAPEFIDITESVEDYVRQSEVGTGFAIVFSKHTTAAITIQENEPLLLEDMAHMIERVSPRNLDYRHNDFSVRTVHMHENECPNGHSHCQHLTLGSSETIPIVDGKMTLGKWQRIFMVELDDGKPVPHRNILVQVMGI
jgi:secondary thiamine-phosphate synthase enzyme